MQGAEQPPRTDQRATDAPTTTPDEHALVEQYMPLVDHVVAGLMGRFPRHIDRSELWAAGAEGLVDAVRRYDPDTGVPFGHYARIRIRGAIIDSTRSRDWATRSMRRTARTVRAAESVLIQRHGRQPTIAEIAEEAQLDLAALEALQADEQRSQLLTLDRPGLASNGDATSSLLDDLVADVGEQPDSMVLHGERVALLKVAVSRLAPHLRKLIMDRFFRGVMLQDVAAELGVTEARVSQMLAEAIHSLRCVMATYDEVVPDVPESAPGLRRRRSYLAAMDDVTRQQVERLINVTV